MSTKKDYVKISSDIAIGVTKGLDYDDVTNKDAHIPDRLRVLPKWSKDVIRVKPGAHFYPSAILEWPTVKHLVATNHFTVGVFADNEDGTNNPVKKEAKAEAKAEEAKE